MTTPEQIAEYRALANAGKEAHWLAFEAVPALCDTVAELQRQNAELLKQLNRMATVADVYGADGVEFFEVRNDSLALIAKYGGGRA